MMTYLDDFYVAGAKFYQLPWVLNTLKVGDEVKLIPDPENRHDQNAVELHIDKYKLGFVPRTNNLILQQLLFASTNITARISVLNVQEEQWKQVKVTLYTISDEKAA